MAFAGRLGIEADLRGLPKTDDCTNPDTQLFSESNSRYIVELSPDKYDAFARLMLNLPFGQIGEITDSAKLVIRTEKQNNIIDLELDILKEAWQQPLKL